MREKCIRPSDGRGAIDAAWHWRQTVVDAQMAMPQNAQKP